jgi:hypothetical protein
MEDDPMSKKRPKEMDGVTAPKQPEREQVQEWEDEGGATKPSAPRAQHASPAEKDEGLSDEPRGRSGRKRPETGGTRPATRDKSRSRTGR